MTFVLGRLAEWLPSGLRTAATHAGASFLLGTADERALNRIAKAAVFRTAQRLLPEGNPEQISAAAAVIDEVFTPHSLLNLDLGDEASGVADAFRAALIQQLSILFEPLDDGGFSTAGHLGLTTTVEALADQLMSDICVLIGFEAPSDAATLQALRQEYFIASVAAVRRRITADRTPQLHIRYLVCRSIDILADIVAQRFDRLPVASPIVFPNEVTNFWRVLVTAHRGDTRHDAIRGARFATSVEYRQSYPDSRRPAPNEHLPAYDLIRECTQEDVRQSVAPSDPISLLLLESGVAPSDVCLVVGHHKLCGGERVETFLEEYLVRPVWGLLAELLIPGEALWTLQSWDGYAQDAGIEKLCTVTGNLNTPGSLGRLPGAPIEPAQSVVIPLATLVPRFPLPPEHYEVLDSEPAESGAYQELKLSMFRRQELHLDVWGPARIPDRLTVASGSEGYRLPVRQFEPRLLYAIDRVWYEGCCPHVFELGSEAAPRYRGTAFSHGPSLEQVFKLQHGFGATHLVVAELESEATFIRQALVDGRLAAADVWITRERPLVIPLQSADRETELNGFYVVPAGQTLRSSSAQRNSAVRDYMRRLTTDALPG
jgi:hypothetical protein